MPANSNQQSGGAPSLNKLNYINAISYIVNFVVTYGVGNLGWVGNGTNAQLSEKYQTLVTPKAAAFGIWAIIFVTQAFFAVAQFLPRFRALDIVQKGVGYYYAWTCLFQALWTFAFAYEIIWLSFIFMLSIWTSLFGIVYSQYGIAPPQKEGNDEEERMKKNLVEFWLFRFPFSIHFGWITAASALNLNIIFVDRGAPADTQLAVGILSLAVLHAISVWVTLSLREANHTVAGVLSWANVWIYAELQSPKGSIVDQFAAGTISGVSLAARAVAVIILLQIIVRISTPRLREYLGFSPIFDDENTGGIVTAGGRLSMSDNQYERPLLGNNGTRGSDGLLGKTRSPGVNSTTTENMDAADLESF